MGKQPVNAISPRREEDYPMWYQEVVKASEMAERSPVRGCMVIKPWGYALWENIMHQMGILHMHPKVVYTFLRNPPLNRGLFQKV